MPADRRALGLGRLGAADGVGQYGVVQAVLFDWRGTLVVDLPDAWWIERALQKLARTPDAGELERLEAGLLKASRVPEVADAKLRADCDAIVHRNINLQMFRLAGLDEELAVALYELDFDPASHPLYPDVGRVLRALKNAGVRVAVVSNIHFDFRSEFAQAGLDPYVDEFILSFEHGVQKPDARIFELALNRLGVGAADTLMVGDRANDDGGAAALGITTVILPPLRAILPRGLDIALRITGGPR